MVEGIPSQETLARLLLCRFLTKGFSYPGADLLEILSTEVVWEELTLAGELLGLEVNPILIELREWLDRFEADEKRLLLDLQIEHTYLFITARPHAPAPPYESAYYGRGYLMGDPAFQVLEAYREAGLAMHKDYDALPDHFAAEMEFLSYLIQQEIEAAQTGDWAGAENWRERQTSFLNKHLLHWGPRFLAKVTVGARQPFYGLLANLAGMVIQSEGQWMSMATQI
jgi:TorA maturation chaperone TorD